MATWQISAVTARIYSSWYLDANAGTVRVYSLNGSTWTQRGFDVVHDTGNTFFGYAVAISPDGTKFAAGGNGLVRVFTNEALGTRSARSLSHP